MPSFSDRKVKGQGHVGRLKFRTNADSVALTLLVIIGKDLTEVQNFVQSKSKIFPLKSEQMMKLLLKNKSIVYSTWELHSVTNTSTCRCNNESQMIGNKAQVKITNS